METADESRRAIEKLIAEGQTEFGKGVYRVLLTKYNRGDLASTEVEEALKTLKRNACADYIIAVNPLSDLKSKLWNAENPRVS